MSDIKSIIRLNCDEELDIRYFTKDEYITDSTIDHSELLEYINEIEDKNERLENIIKEVREYITKQVHRNQQFYEMDIENILEILDKGE